MRRWRALTRRLSAFADREDRGRGRERMIGEVVLRRGTVVVRRLGLEVGEAMPWHRDPYQRVTIILAGEALAIEFRDGGEPERFGVRPGEVDWDEPTDRVHRGVNVGDTPYEEITVFFLDRPDADPQPRA
jgi:quercetin dioxygenase-like cupin family protein